MFVSTVPSCSCSDMIESPWHRDSDLNCLFRPDVMICMHAVLSSQNLAGYPSGRNMSQKSIIGHKYREQAVSAATSSASAVQLQVRVCRCDEPAMEKKVLSPSIATWAPLVDLNVRGQPAKFASADTPTPKLVILSPIQQICLWCNVYQM